MKPFRLSYSRTGTVILAIIFIPVFGIGLLLTFLLHLPKITAEWIIITIICIFLVLLAILVLYVVTKKATVPCKLIVNEHGVSFRLERSSFLYKRNTFYANWENIANISENYNTGDLSFYSITFTKPRFTANFSAIKGSEDDAETFYNELIYYQEVYNLNHLNYQISSKSFYDTIWARSITWICYLLTAVATCLHLYAIQDVKYYQLISFVCFAIVWLSSYYKNTKKLY